MKRLVAIFGLLLASGAQADVAPSDADFAALISVIEARGCVVLDKNDTSILTESKLSSDVAYAAIGQMLKDGRAEIVDDALHLKTPGCPAPADQAAAAAKAPVADRAALVALIETHGCKMSEAEAADILPPAGFTHDSTRAIVGDLVSEGLAVVGETGITLKTEKCR